MQAIHNLLQRLSGLPARYCSGYSFGQVRLPVARKSFGKIATHNGRMIAICSQSQSFLQMSVGNSGANDLMCGLYPSFRAMQAKILEKGSNGPYVRQSVNHTFSLAANSIGRQSEFPLFAEFLRIPKIFRIYRFLSTAYGLPPANAGRASTVGGLGLRPGAEGKNR